MSDSTDAAFEQVMRAIEDVTPPAPDLLSPAHPAPRPPVVVLLMAFAVVIVVGTVGLAVSRIEPETDVSGSQPSVTLLPVVTTLPDQAPSTTVAITTSIASTTTTVIVVDVLPDDDTANSNPRRCPKPLPLPLDKDVLVPLWVVGIHTRMTTLVQDMNMLAEAAWAAAPNDAGWAREEPVARAVEAVESDLTDIRAYSTAALEDAGLKWTTTGWTERVNTEGSKIEGPIWWLPEGIWSKAEHLKDHVLPEFLATTGSADVTSFYLHGGASSAGPCATTKFMVEAVNGIIGDLD